MLHRVNHVGTWLAMSAAPSLPILRPQFQRHGVTVADISNLYMRERGVADKASHVPTWFAHMSLLIVYAL